jgi:peptidoglycan/LPS O-acetylase OafA/YrhL
VYKLAALPESPTGVVSRGLKKVAPISYSLYIVQMPLLVFLAALWVRWVAPLPNQPWLVFPAVSITLVAAWTVATLIERPLDDIGKKLTPVRYRE